jgi:hypothetical protein
MLRQLQALVLVVALRVTMFSQRFHAVVQQVHLHLHLQLWRLLQSQVHHSVLLHRGQ